MQMRISGLTMIVVFAVGCTTYEAPYPTRAQVAAQRITVFYGSRINAYDITKIQMRNGCFTCTKVDFTISTPVADATGYYDRLYLDFATALGAAKYYLSFSEGSASGSIVTEKSDFFSSGSEKTVFASEPGVFIFNYP